MHSIRKNDESRGMIKRERDSGAGVGGVAVARHDFSCPCAVSSACYQRPASSTRYFLFAYDFLLNLLQEPKNVKFSYLFN